MDGRALRQARLGKGWTQQQTAREFGVTQAYWSMFENGFRPVPPAVVRRALRALKLPPTALPLPGDQRLEESTTRKHDFSRELGVLGYPGFAHLGGKAGLNPALLLFDALNEPDLDPRVREGLPWLVLAYSDMDWNWLVKAVKLHDRQNRLGFAVAIAREVAGRKHEQGRSGKFKEYLEELEPARLAREDTFCHDGMTQAERKWLRQHRSSTAQHWNLLTDMRGERLAYD